MKLLKNLYCYPWYGLENNCNSYFFDDEIRTLVDPGHEWGLTELLGSLEKDGFRAKDIELIINTHVHPDHCEANPTLLEQSRAKVALHRLEEKYLEGEARQLYSMFGIEPPKFRPAFYLADTLNLGDVNLTILHTPGHSPGSISVYWPSAKALICGDLVFEGGVGRTDFPGGNLEQLQKSIELVSKLDTEYLLPGHGNMIQGKANIHRNFAFIKEIFM